MAWQPAVERAEWAVFHGAVTEAIPLLQQVPGLQGREALYASWLLSVSLGAVGRYSEALDTLERIPPATPEYSMARSLRASLLRQLGCHDLALVADREAMSNAATPGAAIEAMTGLAADAVGLQDSVTAENTLNQAKSLLVRVAAENSESWWRHMVRVEWVACEIALMSSDSVTAVARAERALELAENANAPRHVAKSLLFLAVAQIESGRTDAAAANLRRSLMLSNSMGYLAVSWPAHAVLAALLKAGDPAAAHAHFVSAAKVIATLRSGLTGELATRWDARPDVAALLREAS